MTLNKAKVLLSTAVRSELRDHAFGDREIYWDVNGKEVASGYFGCDSSVSIKFKETTCTRHCRVEFDEHSEECIKDSCYCTFDGKEAEELAACGVMVSIERTDETGPDEFVQGQIMPGLTKEGVLREICDPPKENGSKG